MIDIEDVPKELIDQIKERFDADQRVAMLRVQHRMLQDKGDYMKALEVAERIDYLFSECVATYLSEAEKEVEKFDLTALNLSDEDNDRFMQLALVMFMACDIINSAVIDANTVLRKYDKDVQLEEFKAITDIASEAKAKLSFLNKNSDYTEDLIWGDKCDNMYDMIQSKAKAILNKRKTDSYGRNTERFK